MNRDVPPIPGYPEPYGLLCAILEDASADWQSEIHDDLPAESMTWRVRTGGQTMGAIMLHMIGVEMFWIERFVLGKEWDLAVVEELMLREIDVDEGHWPAPPHQPLSWYLDLHRRYRTRTLESIKNWPPADTLLDREGEEQKYTPRWVLGHVIQHESYHGGQVVLLADLWKQSRN